MMDQAEPKGTEVQEIVHQDDGPVSPTSDYIETVNIVTAPRSPVDQQTAGVTAEKPVHAPSMATANE